MIILKIRVFLLLVFCVSEECRDAVAVVHFQVAALARQLHGLLLRDDVRPWVMLLLVLNVIIGVTCQLLLLHRWLRLVHLGWLVELR